MTGDKLASGGKSVTFGPANTVISQEKWDKAFGTHKEKEDGRRQRKSKSNS